MRDRNVLIEAIITAYENESYQPVFQNGVLQTTFCNIAANEIAQKVGCTDFYDSGLNRPKTADEIYSFVIANSDKWQEILCATLQPEFQSTALNAVQMWANSACLTIAIQNAYNLGQEHGHIVVIRPGVMCTSGKWGQVPRCVNIGASNFISLAKEGVMKGLAVGINESFKIMPRFFCWKGS